MSKPFLFVLMFFMFRLNGIAQSPTNAPSGKQLISPRVDKSAEKKITPPTEVAASDGEYPDYILVTWAEGLKGTKYRVYRAVSDSISLMKPIGDKWTSDIWIYDQQGLVAGLEYYYRVKARIGTEESNFSQVDIGYIPAPRPIAAPRDTLITRDSIPADTLKREGN